MSNRHPDVSGLCPPGRGAVGWCGEQVDSWVHARIKGVPWVCPPMPTYPTVIRKVEVLRRVGLSHVTIWKLERRGLFPRRFKLTDPAPVVADDAAQ